MLLKNFTNLIHIFTSGGYSSDGLQPNFKYDDGTSGDALARYNVSTQNIIILPKGDSGYTTDNQLGVYYLNGNTSTCNNQFRCVTLLVGTGTTPVTFDDYALTRETTLTTVGVQNPTVDKNGKFTISHTLQNNTSADITITELGLARAGTKTNNYPATATSYILLTRDVLDNPVTIPVGESRIFSIVIDQWNFSTGYNQSVSVPVPKTITQNRVYNPADDNADGYSSVTVNVSGGAPQNIPMEINSGVLERPQTSFSYTMPSSVTSIGSYALQTSFAHSAVNDITFSSDLVDIGEGACLDMCVECSNLGNVYIGGDSNGLQITGDYALQNAFAYSSIVAFDASYLESISGLFTFSTSFTDCSNLISIDFSGLTSITGERTFQEFCAGCTSLEDVLFDNLANIGTASNATNDGAFAFAFRGCEALISVSFDSLEEVYGESVFQAAFDSCTSLQTLSFPSLRTIPIIGGLDPFEDMLTGCEDVTVHFPSALQSTIENYQSVLDGFGGTNTTVLFDL